MTKIAKKSLLNGKRFHKSISKKNIKNRFRNFIRMRKFHKTKIRDKLEDKEKFF